MKPDPIRITYYGGEPPDVVVPPELTDLVTIELVDADEAGLFFLEYEGVRIYRTTKHSGALSEFWFNTRPSDYEDPRCFDIRDLPPVPPGQKKQFQNLFPDDGGEKALIAYAIDLDLIRLDESLSLSDGR